MASPYYYRIVILYGDWSSEATASPAVHHARARRDMVRLIGDRPGRVHTWSGGFFEPFAADFSVVCFGKDVGALGTSLQEGGYSINFACVYHREQEDGDLKHFRSKHFPPTREERCLLRGVTVPQNDAYSPILAAETLFQSLIDDYGTASLYTGDADRAQQYRLRYFAFFTVGQEVKFVFSRALGRVM